jgi:transglutaminase/protease-like cytokinesis protein 3
VNRGVMKLLATIFLVFVFNLSFVQGQKVDFSSIDYRVQFIDATNPDSLAQKLVAPYTDDLQKVRAIFRWITENISYQTIGRYKRVLPTWYIQNEIEEDNSMLKPLDKRVAENVLRKKEAVCDGYSRLFKALCDAAGIRSEIIIGFARGNNGGNLKFRSNHTWNAVYIESTWHLLDVTWASGFISFGGDFIKHFDESYFLTPPKQFIQDHFPEDLQWTLLEDPPVVKEFQRSPFKHSAFIKHKILSYKPSDGIIDASVGDKLVFELETIDAKNELVVASGNISDPSLMSAVWIFARPNASINDNKVSYTFKVEEAKDKWLNIIYKGDVVMRYKLRIKNDTVVR